MLYGKRVSTLDTKIYSFLKVMMLSLFSVDDLPTTHDSDFRGARALPSITGNGAYVQYRKYFYECFVVTVLVARGRAKSVLHT